MPGKNDLGDFIGDLHLEVHENGIRIFSRAARAEAWNEENITLKSVLSFIVSWKK